MSFCFLRLRISLLYFSLDRQMLKFVTQANRQAPLSLLTIARPQMSKTKACTLCPCQEVIIKCHARSKHYAKMTDQLMMALYGKLLSYLGLLKRSIFSSSRLRKIKTRRFLSSLRLEKQLHCKTMTKLPTALLFLFSLKNYKLLSLHQMIGLLDFARFPFQLFVYLKLI